MSNFFDENLTTKNIANFHMRKSIFQGIKSQEKFLSGKLLDIGCGQMPYREYLLENTSVSLYVGLDIETAITYNEEVRPDVQWDGNALPFKNSEFDSILLTEVLEHCFDVQNLLKEAARVLKPEGSLVFTTPFMWPLHETPHDAQRFTPYALEKLFTDAGFYETIICPGGGWHASLAQMLGLWAGRAPLKPWQRKLAGIVLVPIIRILLQKDVKTDQTFKEQQMYTNFYGRTQKKD